jgi:hypothetical protein
MTAKIFQFVRSAGDKASVTVAKRSKSRLRAKASATPLPSARLSSFTPEEIAEMQAMPDVDESEVQGASILRPLRNLERDSRLPDPQGSLDWLYGREPAGKRWIRARMPTLSPEQVARALNLRAVYLVPGLRNFEEFLLERSQADLDRLLNEGGVPGGDRTPGRIRRSWEVAVTTTLEVVCPLVDTEQECSFGTWSPFEPTGAELRWVQALVERDLSKAVKAWPILRMSSRVLNIGPIKDH